MSEPFFLFTSLFDLREAFLLTLLLIGGRWMNARLTGFGKDCNIRYDHQLTAEKLL